MLLTRHGIRTLGPDDRSAFAVLVDRDPAINVFAGWRARMTNLDPQWLGGEVWGRFDNGRLIAACHAATNLVPVNCTPDDAQAFGERAARSKRTCTTITGPRDAIEGLWAGIGSAWGAPREQRWEQPHLVMDADPLIEPDPLVRASTPADFGALYPACVAMYSEEVGVSPEVHGGADLYKARVHNLIATGWSFARYESGRLVFKAEVACATAGAAQIQGVWVPPDRRGEGLAAAGMAAVVQAVRRTIAPVVTLYVNAWNTPARAAYERVGFRQTDTFATLMF